MSSSSQFFLDLPGDFSIFIEQFHLYRYDIYSVGVDDECCAVRNKNDSNWNFCQSIPTSSTAFFSSHNFPRFILCFQIISESFAVNRRMEEKEVEVRIWSLNLPYFMFASCLIQHVKINLAMLIINYF